MVKHQDTWKIKDNPILIILHVSAAEKLQKDVCRHNNCSDYPELHHWSPHMQCESKLQELWDVL